VKVYLILLDTTPIFFIAKMETTVTYAKYKSYEEKKDISDRS
jgi:hypothetical protein